MRLPMPFSNYSWLKRVRNEDRERLNGDSSMLLTNAPIISLDNVQTLARLQRDADTSGAEQPSSTA